MLHIVLHMIKISQNYILNINKANNYFQLAITNKARNTKKEKE